MNDYDYIERYDKGRNDFEELELKILDCQKIQLITFGK